MIFIWVFNYLNKMLMEINTLSNKAILLKTIPERDLVKTNNFAPRGLIHFSEGVWCVETLTSSGKNIPLY